jgi:fatty acid desaturase
MLNMILGRAKSGSSKRKTASTRAPVRQPLGFDTSDERLAAFGRALDQLKAEVEAQLGKEDARHILRIGRLSRALEIGGRVLLQLSLEPVSFSLATGALFLHKALELMEIGHPALHGCYDGLPGADRFYSAGFHWKSPVDEDSWRKVHNVKHHQWTNIEGKDPDLNFGVLRLSARVPYRLGHVLQPVSNLFSTFGFGTALNLHVTGMLDIYLQNAELQVLPNLEPATVGPAKRAFARKMLRHFGKEYVLYPLLAGPFFGKVLLGNMLS